MLWQINNVRFMNRYYKSELTSYQNTKQVSKYVYHVIISVKINITIHCGLLHCKNRLAGHVISVALG